MICRSRVAGGSENGVSDCDISETGDGGIVQHWNGQAWLYSDWDDAEFYSLAALSPQDVWAVGIEQLRHWDGNHWTLFPDPLECGPWFDVAMTTPSDGWAIGGYQDQSTLAHWDGAAWSLVPSAIHHELRGIHMTAPDAGWIVADNGVIHVIDTVLLPA